MTETDKFLTLIHITIMTFIRNSVSFLPLSPLWAGGSNRHIRLNFKRIDSSASSPARLALSILLPLAVLP